MLTKSVILVRRLQAAPRYPATWPYRADSARAMVMAI